jgi:hypothetical protein
MDELLHLSEPLPPGPATWAWKTNHLSDEDAALALELALRDVRKQLWRDLWQRVYDAEARAAAAEARARRCERHATRDPELVPIHTTELPC